MRAEQRDSPCTAITAKFLPGRKPALAVLSTRIRSLEYDCTRTDVAAVGANVTGRVRLEFYISSDDGGHGDHYGGAAGPLAMNIRSAVTYDL